MTTEEKLDRLTTVVDALAASVVHHDNQIEILIRLAKENEQRIAALAREWQAYLSTIHPRQ